MPAIRPDAIAVEPDVLIRPLREGDLPEVDRIFRLAFGTFIGYPDPLSFAAGHDLIGPRFRHNPDGMFVAEVGGRLAGSAIANRWGSMGFFGPLTVHPEFWDRKLGRRLMEPCMDTFTRWGCTHVALFTFPQSAKHVALYQKFGFWPRFLTALMSKPIVPAAAEPFKPVVFADLAADNKKTCLETCRQLCEEIYPGLDVTEEIRAVDQQKLGDTVLVFVGHRLQAFAVCHYGIGTEGGPEWCYVKFAAVRPGAAASADFKLLLNACEELAVVKKLKRVVAGVSTARHEAYRQMIEAGYRADVQGLGMHKDNDEGYSKPGVFVLDDWR